MDYEKITWALNDDGVARIAMNDTAARNAAGQQMSDELRDALHKASIEARAVVITGEGGQFSAGANLTETSAAMLDPHRDIGLLLEKNFNRIIMAMRDMEQPVVTAVSGAAAGVGAAMALAGDMIVAGESSFFLQAFCNIGLVPDGGATWLLVNAVGRARATEMMMLGERLPAATALEWGLINRVVADDAVESTAMELATRLAKGPAALAQIKKLAWAAADSSFEQVLIAERNAQRVAGRSEDFVEGVAAFTQKRKAQFKGR